jgi:type I restriction enzyme S subunit
MGKSWVNNHAHVLKFIGANRIFAEYFINSIDISQFLSGTTRPKLNKGSLMDILIPFPDPKELELIAHILRFCDSKIAPLDHEARLLQELFRAIAWRS